MLEKNSSAYRCQEWNQRPKPVNAEPAKTNVKVRVVFSPRDIPQHTLITVFPIKTNSQFLTTSICSCNFQHKFSARNQWNVPIRLRLHLVQLPHYFWEIISIFAASCCVVNAQRSTCDTKFKLQLINGFEHGSSHQIASHVPTAECRKIYSSGTDCSMEYNFTVRWRANCDVQCAFTCSRSLIRTVAMIACNQWIIKTFPASINMAGGRGGGGVMVEKMNTKLSINRCQRQQVNIYLHIESTRHKRVQSNK